MKEMVIASGKGGTGKTVITASLGVVAENKVLADADVDAANLHLLVNPKIQETYTFHGGKKASIDYEKCENCGKCQEFCRFGAIYKEGEKYFIDEYACEGCGVCYLVCPHQAIKLEIEETGEFFVSSTPYGPLVHAQLGIAQENSGKLVSVVREKARELAVKEGLEYILIDGPPGIGCPVISALSGVNTALIVTEPTLSGIHDMERVIGVAYHFGVKVFLLINKFDINPKNCYQIEEFAQQNNIEVIGKIPFHEKIIDAVKRRIPPVEVMDKSFKKTIIELWERLREA